MLNFECAFLRLYHKDAVWQLGEVDVDGIPRFADDPLD